MLKVSNSSLYEDGLNKAPNYFIGKVNSKRSLCQNNVREQGTFLKMEAFFLLIVNGNTGNVGGQKVVGELDAFEFQMKRVGQAMGQ